LLLLAVVGWLMWRQWPQILALPDHHASVWAMLGLLIGLLAYAFGRTQEFIRIEILSLWWISISLLLICKGWAALRASWFVWVFALFIIPLPFSVVLTLTAPLKEAVSALATTILSTVGYPHWPHGCGHHRGAIPVAGGRGLRRPALDVHPGGHVPAV
jgi:hypothetical protein